MEKIVIEKGKTYETKQRFADMRFLASAVGDDVSRPNMQDVIHAETDGDETILVATDGRRLHMVTYTPETAPLKAGDYRITTKKSDTIIMEPIAFLGISENAHFPNWRRVMPEDPIWLYDGLSFNRRKIDEFGYAVHMINRLGFCFNQAHLEALDLDGAIWSMACGQRNLTGPIVFKSNCRKRQAVIMPMAFDKEAAVENASAELEKLRSAKTAENLTKLGAAMKRYEESQPEPEPEHASEPEPEPVAESAPEPESAPVADAEPEPIVYWINYSTGRYTLKAGLESVWKEVTSRPSFQISRFVYEKAKKTCYPDNLNSYEVDLIRQWQRDKEWQRDERRAAQEQAAAAPVTPPPQPESTPVTPEPVAVPEPKKQRAADKPVTPPKKQRAAKKPATNAETETEKTEFAWLKDYYSEAFGA